MGVDPTDKTGTQGCIGLSESDLRISCAIFAAASTVSISEVRNPVAWVKDLDEYESPA